MTRRTLSYRAALLATLTPFAATAAHGQSAAASQDQSAAAADEAYTADIIVTAQKREQSLQEVPIAITALSGDALAERAIDNVSSLAAVTPNVNLDGGSPFSGSSAVLSAFIRGIGRDDFAINLDPGVGVYLDGVYLARTVGANIDLPDVERVEVLKGPQGTLFGRNTIGGAISVVTRTPGDTFAFRGQLATGSYSRLDMSASADLPIMPGLSALVTFAVKSRDGYQRRIPYPSATPYITDPVSLIPQTGYQTYERSGGENERTLRGKLVWDGSPDLRVTLAADYQKVDQSALPNTLLGIVSRPGAFAGLAARNIPGTALDPSGQTGFNYVGLYNFCIGATPAEIAGRNAQNLCGPRGTPLDPGAMLPALGSANVDGDPTNNRLPFDNRWVSTDPDVSYATGNNFSIIESYGGVGTIDLDLSDTTAVRSITAYRELRFNSGVDLDNSPIQYLETSFSQRQKQFSQELQLLGNLFDKKLNYVLGAYYFFESGAERGFANVGHGQFGSSAPAWVKSRAYAVFGQVDWRLNDLIGITVGARYTKEDKELEAGQADRNGFFYKLFNCVTYDTVCRTRVGFPNASAPLQLYPAGVQKRSFDNFSPKFGVQLHPSDDVMVYGSWSRGYKSGGWTIRISNPTAVAPTFDEEVATTWEVGVKSTLFDRLIQLNVAAFTTDYNGIQLNFIQGTSPTIRNAGEARIKGVEVEATLRPSRAFQLSAAAGYIDASYTAIQPSAAIAPSIYQAGTFVGAPLPKTPEFKLNVSPRYELDLAESGRLVFVADYTHTSSLWNDTERTLLLKRPTTDVFNASITYEHPSNHWRLTAGGTNITNERYLMNGLANLGGGLIYGAYNRPAEWYARVGVSF